MGQSDGQVIVAANAIVDGSGGGIVGQSEVVLTRISSTGASDPTFGLAGEAVIPGPTFGTIVRSIGVSAVKLQADGKIVLGGAATYGTGSSGQVQTNPTVLRLNSNGTLDPSFGIAGGDILTNRSSPVSTPITSLIIEANGDLVTADQVDFGFSRFLPDGLPDPTFGEGGTAFIPQTGAFASAAQATVISSGSNGKIMALLTGGGSPELARLLATGSAGDFNGDGLADPAVLETAASTLVYQPSGGGSAVTTSFGSPGAGDTMPTPGAFNGGGITEVAAYLPLSAQFAVQPSTGGPVVFTPFGTPGFGNSLPAPGDYSHSGRTEYAVYLPALGDFIYRPDNPGAGPDIVVQFGLAGAGRSIPVPADYFGTGQDDFAVYEPAKGDYVIMNPVNGQVSTIPFGAPGPGQTIPLPGDYDGSGHAELAVYLPASGRLIYRPASGGADVAIPFGNPGLDGFLPAIGDYDGAGHAEVAGYDPVAGTFSFLPSGGGTPVTTTIGLPNAQSVPFSADTNIVAEVNAGLPAPTPGAHIESVSTFIPLTPDMLDTLASPTPKKKGANG